MKKNLILLLLAIIFVAGKINAQTIIPCGTDEMAKIYKQGHPEIAIYEQQLEDQISKYLNHTDMRKYAAKRTSTHTSDTDYYDIPLVVHVMHNYGPELLDDNKIYTLVAEMNRFYSLQYDYSSVIPPFKPYVGKANFRFHLATKDPNGNPTKGITHHFTYLTTGGDDQAKMDQWPPSSYVNIWFEARIGAQIPNGIIVAYATQPPSAAAYPFSDGIICNYSFINDTSTGHAGGSVDHEMGHIMNLYHTFGHTNNPHTNVSGSCNDDDGVDDTPPTEGNLGGCNLYDTVCANNYWKLYTNVSGGDSLVNYPDTSNEQNIMNYADCKVMFTKGQVERMRAALNSDVANRNNLWDSTNLVITGALSPLPDLAPVVDFSPRLANNSILSWFTCPNTPLKFANNCWGDTLQSVTWTFGNTADVPSVTYTGSSVTSAVTTGFKDAGWLNLTIAATGNHSSLTTTANFPRSVFIADPVGVNGASYFQEFSGPDTAKWPTFNYYNNEFKWQPANVGMYDNNSMEYVGYDYRLNTTLGLFPTTGTPLGDYDDMFSIPMDLSMFSGNCYLNYNYSGASRSGRPMDINDTMVIDYSIDHGKTYQTLAKLTKGDLDNKGAYAMPYVPTGPSDWAPMGLYIPSVARTTYTVFRFRYRPSTSGGPDGTPASGFLGSTGNNFYIDRINFSQWPAAVANVAIGDLDIAVAPNPTSGDAYVIIKDGNNMTAKIVVTDITGKTVYSATEQLTGSETHIQIPHNAISVKGMYLIQTTTGSLSATRKLIVD